MTDLPSAAKPFKIVINSSISCGVKTAVGSSKIKISAPRYNVFKISTRCCIPTEMSPANAFGSTSKPYCSDNFLISAAAVFVSNFTPLTGSEPKMMFSVTVNASINIKCWCTIPIPNSAAFDGLSTITFSPLIKMSPAVGCNKPDN